MNKAELIRAVQEKCYDDGFAGKTTMECVVITVFDVIRE